MQFKTLAEVKAITRIKVDKDKLKDIPNKSMHDLTGFVFEKQKYFGDNYSYCDFNGTDLTGCKFVGCNFSFSVNLNKAKTEGVVFEGCNFSGADLPINKLEKSNNLHIFTDKDIKEMFKESIN